MNQQAIVEDPQQTQQNNPVLPNVEPSQGTQPNQTPPSTVQPDPSEDLLARVTAFQKDNASSTDPQNNGEGGQPDNLEATIANIEDPTVRSQFEKLRKDLVSGTNVKFQEIATLRKEMQSNMEQLKKVGQPDEWTPERVQQLASDPKFIEAAQQISGVQTDSDEYSALSDVEKKTITDMKVQLEELKRTNQQSLIAQQQQIREQQHAEYSSKYSNYNPQKIDEITFGLQKQEIQATNEHIYKAFYHDENVNNAYEMGRRDEREGITDKVASSTLGGITTQQSAPVVETKEGESSADFFSRIIESTKAKMSKK